MTGINEIEHKLIFKGGLNTVDPPTEIADDELVECNNFFVGSEGQLRKRFGFFKYKALDNPGQPYGFLGQDWSSTRVVMAANIGSGIIYRYNYQSNFADTYSGHPGLEIPRWYLYVNAKGYMGFVTTPGIRPVTGTTVGANLANSPQSSVAAFHKNRIFTNVTNVPGRLFFSDPLDPTVGEFTFQTTNFIPIDLTNSEEISALVPLGDLLLIFKWNSVWVLYVQGTSPADWVVRRISNRLGASSSYGNHKTTIVYNNEAFFIDRQRGVWKTNGSSFQELSKKVWRYPEGIFGLSSNDTYLGITTWDHYLLVTVKSYTMTLQPTKITLVMNLETGAWSTWDFNGTVFDDFITVPFQISGPSPEYLLATSSNAVYAASPEFDPVYYNTLLTMGYNTSADGQDIAVPYVYGTAFNSTFQTKEFTNSVDKLIRMKYMGLEYTAYGSPTFKSVLDGVQGAAQTPGFNSTLRKGYKISGGGRGRTFALRGEHALTSPYELLRVGMHLNSKIPILASGS